jgi:hypothetical protein
MMFFLLVGCGEKMAPVPLTYDHIKYLTIDGMSDAEVEKISLHELKTAQSQEYLAVKDDEEKLAALVAGGRSKLRQKSQQNPRVFELEHEYFQRKLSQKDQSINFVYNFNKTGTIISDVDKDFVFPQHIIMLLTNLDALAEVPLDQVRNFDASEEHKLLFKIEVIEAQHSRYIQAMIKEFQFIATGNNEVLYQFNETRSGSEILQARLLPNGFSLDLVAVHSFSFFGRRVLDPIIENSVSMKNCKQQTAIGKHDRLLCEFTYFESDEGQVIYEVQVVGGRMTSLKLKAIGTISATMQKSIIDRAARELKVKPEVLLQTNARNFMIKPRNSRVKDFKVNDDIIQWVYFNVQVTYHRAAFLSGDSEQSTIFELRSLEFDKYVAENH